MHRLAVGLLAVLLATCKSRAPYLDAQSCIGAEVEFWSAQATGVAQARERLACAELYRQTRCGDAWRAELRLADRISRSADVRTVEALPDATRIAKACADAYCAELGTKPLLCKAPPPPANAELIKALRELDSAILTRELGDARTAQTVAHRALVFRSVVVPMDPALALGAAPARGKDASVVAIDIDMAENGNIFLNGRAVTFEQLPAELAKLEPLRERRAVLRVDGRVPYGSVIAALDVLKRAGVPKIAFATSPAKP